MSNNNITESDSIVAILETNASLKLERLDLELNHLQGIVGDRLSLAIANLKHLKVLSIDQSVISSSSLIAAFSTAADRKLLIYNHNYQRTEVIDVRGSLKNFNALTLCKIPIVREGQPVITFVLDNGSVMLWWSQSDMLSTSGVLRFINSLKKITTIKLRNDSGSELTELEVDTIATVISENVQLKNVWLGSQSLKTIHDDFVALRSNKSNDNKKKQKMTLKKILSQATKGLSINRKV